MNRCIPYLINEGKHENTSDGRKAASGECYGIYDSWKKKQTNNEKVERVHLNLCAELFNRPKKTTFSKTDEFDRATLLVGDGTYKGIYFPSEEIQKAFMTWERQPINLDHSSKVEDEVGFVKDIHYNSVSKRLTGQPILNDYMPKAKTARGYIKSRFDAGKTPENSVGVWLDRIPEEMSDGEIRLTGRNLYGDHLALVTRGACSPQDGCGIGMSKNIPITISVDDYELTKNEFEWKTLDELKKQILKEKIKKEHLRR